MPIPFTDFDRCLLLAIAGELEHTQQADGMEDYIHAMVRKAHPHLDGPDLVDAVTAATLEADNVIHRIREELYIYTDCGHRLTPAQRRRHLAPFGTADDVAMARKVAMDSLTPPRRAEMHLIAANTMVRCALIDRLIDLAMPDGSDEQKDKLYESYHEDMDSPLPFAITPRLVGALYARDTHQGLFAEYYTLLTRRSPDLAEQNHGAVISAMQDSLRPQRQPTARLAVPCRFGLH